MLHVIQNEFVFVAGKKPIQSAKLLETSIGNCDRIWDRERVRERVKILGNLATAPPPHNFPTMPILQGNSNYYSKQGKCGDQGVQIQTQGTGETPTWSLQISEKKIG